MRPLISYYGGKQRLASKIVPLLPPHTVYVEPFAGGASVLFAKGKPPVTNHHHYREVINDTLGNLVTLYRVAKLQPDALFAQIDATLFARSEYDRAVSIYKEPDGHDDVTVAWATYVAVMQAFANVPGGGWAMQVKAQNNAETWQNRMTRLPEQLDRLKDIYVEQDDALNVIKRWDSPQTVFYCDPPYPDTTQGHYSGYTQDDFDALLETLGNCKGSFVLSCYPNDAVPNEWKRVDFTARMSASNGRSRTEHKTTRTECVWVVDRSDTMPDDLKRIATDYRPKQKQDEPTLFGANQ